VVVLALLGAEEVSTEVGAEGRGFWKNILSSSVGASVAGAGDGLGVVGGWGVGLDEGVSVVPGVVVVVVVVVVGTKEGLFESIDEFKVGPKEGTPLGIKEGASEGMEEDGAPLGIKEGASEGMEEGAPLGIKEGASEGMEEGTEESGVGVTDGNVVEDWVSLTGIMV
jgi:hypothetical protein